MRKSKGVKKTNGHQSNKKPKQKPAAGIGVSTSWGHVAEWYQEHVTESADTYHAQVVKPNLLRIVGHIRGKRVLDVACGEGFFSRALRDQGAEVTGTDIAPELIALARQKGPSDITYVVSKAEERPFPPSSFDSAVCVLALQNIKDLSGTISNIAHSLEHGGSFIFVLNHPAFRIPKLSQWGFDSTNSTQFRRLDRYLSESTHQIQMHPGTAPDVVTVSHHRPLQLYMKELFKHGFVVTGFEEWISHRSSQSGPRQEAEDRARKEFPLFLAIKARRV